MTLRRILTCLGIAIIACIVLTVIAFVVAGPSITAVFNSTVALTDTSTKFLTAIKDHKYDAAFALVSTDQQSSFGGSGDGFKQKVDGWNFGNLTSWTFSSFNINNDQGTVGGDATFDTATKKTVTISLQKIGDGWKVIGVNFK